MTDLGRPLSRRTIVQGTAAAGLLGVAPTSSLVPGASAALVRRRIELPHGVQSGDVTTSSAVLWARAAEPGRLVARLSLRACNIFCRARTALAFSCASAVFALHPHRNSMHV